MFGNLKETSVTHPSGSAAKPPSMNKISAFSSQKNSADMVERPVVSRKL
jgi:hypothetical protein